jgi:hypothetical protein
VKPGTRITYATTQRARVAASTVRLDDAGEWVGADGRRLPEAGDSTERGVAQMTVVALTPSHAVLSITRWRRGSDGNLAFDGETCAVGVPGSAGEVWIDPAVLAGAERAPPSGVRVVRRPYDAGAKRYDAIWFLGEGERADRLSVYDAESGVLVHRAAIEADDADGGRRPVGATIVDVRDATPPWADASPPKWLPMIQWLDYSGMETSSGEGHVGGAIPRTAHVTVEARGPGWMRVGVVDTAAASGDLPVRRPSTVVSGPAQYLGYFIPPPAIAGLKAGAELDRDPTTGFVVRVGNETRVEGRDVVVIVGENAALRVEAAYDVVSGMRVHLSIDDRARRVLTHWKLGG